MASEADGKEGTFFVWRAGSRSPTAAIVRDLRPVEDKGDPRVLKVYDMPADLVPPGTTPDWAALRARFPLQASAG